MDNLTPTDLNYVVQRIPRDIQKLLKDHAGALFVGGGFIRAQIAGETPADIDLFGSDKEFLGTVAAKLFDSRSAEGGNTRKSSTQNAITVATLGRMPVQFITRWVFPNAEALIASFDFTICRSAIWYDGHGWKSAIGAGFYQDLSARRLVYTTPVREEEAGGSMMRVIKYLKRGYTVQAPTLGAVMARVMAKVQDRPITHTELGMAQVITGLLREVDPLLVVDGVDIVDDHEPVKAAA